MVLSRRCGEKILIGEDIWLTVVYVSRDRVRLGIECPRDVPIVRGELLTPLAGVEGADDGQG